MTTKYDALEALEGKATKGPWRADFKMIGLVRTEDGAEITKGKRITSLVQLESNAQFIAAARNAVPTLIADVKALAEALDNRLDIAEECAFDEWLNRTTPSGDITDVQNQWKESYDFSEFCESWGAEIAALKRIQGEAG